MGSWVTLLPKCCALQIYQAWVMRVLSAELKKAHAQKAPQHRWPLEIHTHHTYGGKAQLQLTPIPTSLVSLGLPWVKGGRHGGVGPLSRCAYAFRWRHQRQKKAQKRGQRRNELKQILGRGHTARRPHAAPLGLGDSTHTELGRATRDP